MPTSPIARPGQARPASTAATARHCSTIFSLPARAAEKSRPAFSISARIAVTMSSRTTTTTAIQGAIADPAAASSVNEPQTSTLSTSGSKIRPSRLTWPNRRAHQPSTQSVDAATANSQNAGTYAPRSIATNSTIESTSRAKESRFGTVRMRSLATAQPSAGTPARS